tara:strand:- start:202 stop:2940 length:2739 start_codon:yes stop_codon:yes gene_type:complete
MATLPVGRSPHRPAVKTKKEPVSSSAPIDVETEKKSWSPAMQEFYEEAKSSDSFLPEETNNIPVNPDERLWFGLENLENLTIKQVATASSEEIANFWNTVVAPNKELAEKQLNIPAEVFDEIETLYNETVTGFDAEKAFDTEVASDLATSETSSPVPAKLPPSGYEGKLSSEELASMGISDVPEQPSVSSDPKEGRLSREQMAEIDASPDTAPPARSNTEAELKASLDYIDPTPPWERAEPPNVIDRLWSQLTGQDRPPDDYSMERMTGTIAGSIIGAHTGSKVPPINFLVNPITGALLFSGIGTIVGTVMPETTLELAETLKLLPKGYREKHGFSNARLLYEAENEAMLDFAFGGALTAAQGTWRLAGRYFSKADDESLKMASEVRKKFNINLMPIQLGDRSIARGFAAVFGRFPWVGTKLVDRGLKTAEELTEAYKKLGGLGSSRLGVLMADNEISKMIFRDGQELMKAFKNRFKLWYEQAWKLADEAKVTVRPTFVRLRAKDIIKELDQRATSVKGELEDGEVMAKVRNFIKEKVDGLDDVQTLRQMDGLIGQIDEFLASLEGNQIEFAKSLMGRIRVAASYDMLKHAQGDEALKITRFIRQIDYQFSYTMNSLFESVTAKKFENVYRGGLKKTPSLAEESTKINIDQLAKHVITLESPMAIEQLYKLTGKDTFSQIVQRTLDDAVQKARNVNPDGTEQFFSDRLARHLGLEAGTVASEKESLKLMLKLSKSPLTIEDIELLIKATRKLESLKLPNASTFLARRLQIGGFKSAIRGLLPGMIVAGSTASGGVAGLVISLVGVGTLLGGGKFVSRMISDPKSAMLFKEVAKADAHIISNWKLIPQTLRLTLNRLFGDGSIGEEEFNKLNALIDPLTNDLQQQYQEMFPPGQEKEEETDPDITLKMKKILK